MTSSQSAAGPPRLGRTLARGALADGSNENPSDENWEPSRRYSKGRAAEAAAKPWLSRKMMTYGTIVSTVEPTWYRSFTAWSAVSVSDDIQGEFRQEKECYTSRNWFSSYVFLEYLACWFKNTRGTEVVPLNSGLTDE